ncbi:MAG: Hpt domain-containing protein [Lentimicrobium sp.]|jgi:HPt (histidine-containing phosphotransfer) domain-containing protein|nr:Hpt domain-containing protein [Lentimicrobium sp.]
MVNKQIFIDTYQYFDKAVILEIIDIFIDECPDRLTTLEQNITEASFDKLRFNAHSLKGVVANFSAPAAFEKVKQLEKTASDLVDNNGAGYNQKELLSNLAIIKEMVFEMMDDLKQIKAEY